ncbi:unnamed protein product [Caenorhabditis auriculariae]|uniref:Tyrosine-protein phosphatase domain-containing protein n=1 Tax=Caenorhabditis auriculariae TaxID=2777116 RepID=A0A8S1HI15_9PELO|nr:unnamed protein product [Caenorhabditis auriculariae]
MDKKSREPPAAAKTRRHRQSKNEPPGKQDSTTSTTAKRTLKQHKKKSTDNSLHTQKKTLRKVPSSCNVGPPTAHSPDNVQPATFNPDDQKKNNAARDFVEHLAIVTYKTQYEDLRAIQAPLEQCKIWAANMNRNQTEKYPCFDANRVVLQMCKQDYINATVVSLEGFSPSVILTQVPVFSEPSAVEEFWRMIFHEQITAIHLLCKSEETPLRFGELFPLNTGAYQYFGSMFINNRKTSRDNPDIIKYSIEVLPEGCSNAVMTTVHHHGYWDPLLGPSNFRPALITANQIHHGYEKTAIVSLNGAGRAGTLLALSVALKHLQDGVEPNMKEIVQQIRLKRPLAVDSMQQFGFLYLAFLHHIKRRVPTDLQEKVKEFKRLCSEATSGD